MAKNRRALAADCWAGLDWVGVVTRRLGHIRSSTTLSVGTGVFQASCHSRLAEVVAGRGRDTSNAIHVRRFACSYTRPPFPRGPFPRSSHDGQALQSTADTWTPRPSGSRTRKLSFAVPCTPSKPAPCTAALSRSASNPSTPTQK